MLLYLVILPVAILLSTLVLALSIFTVSDEADNPFKGERLLPGLAKCFAVVLAAQLLNFVPGIGGLLSLAAWCVGVMAFFQMTIGKTLLVLLANYFFSFMMIWVIAYFTERLL